MAAASPTSTPGVSSPLEHISDGNMGGLVAVMAALAWTFVLTAFAGRVYVRWKTGPWKRDDNCLLMATLLSCAQTSIVFYEVSKGLGRASIPSQNVDTLQKADFANDLFYIIVLFLSKCSLGLLYLRLTPAKNHSVTVWAIMTGSAVWAVMSIMLISIRCHVGNPWASWSTECTNFFARWEVIGTLDIVTELGLFMMAIYLVKDLQMSLRAKVVVVAAFGSRLLVIPAAALRLYYLNPDVLSGHRNLAASYVVVCAQLQLGYGLMSVTIPCLKPFIAAYEGPRHPASAYSRSYGNHSDPDYNLKSFNSAQLKSDGIMSSSRELDSDVPVPASGTPGRERGLRPDQTKYSANVSRGPAGQSRHARNERSSDDSRQMIIETKTGWSVEYDAESTKGGDSHVRGVSINEREVGIGV